jgi:LmbE family N-acetylglucosaminyl deacetylase
MTGSAKKDSFFGFRHRLLLSCVLVGLLLIGSAGTLFAEPDEPPPGFDASRQNRELVLMENLRRGVLTSMSWIFLGIGLLMVLLTLRKTYVWLSAVQRARVPPTRYFNLQLKVRDRSGHLSLHNFDYYPVVVAADGTADLLLPGISDPHARFHVDYRHGQAHLSSAAPVIVNGVPRRQKPLKEGDRIVFGPYRLEFRDASIREQPAPLPGRPVFAWQFPIVALLLALSVLFKQAGAVPEDTMLLAKAVELQGAEKISRIEESMPGSAEKISRIEESMPGSARQSAERSVDRRTQTEAGTPQSVEKISRIRRWTEQREEPAGPERAPAGVPVREPAGPGRVPAEVAVREPVSEEPVSEEGAVEQPGSPAQRPAEVPVREPAAASRSLGASHPAPSGKAVVSSDPPADAIAEVPAPRSTNGVPASIESAPPSHQRADQPPPMVQASVLGAVSPRTFRNDGINPLENLSFAKARKVPEIGRTKVRVIPPGRPVEYFKADILFIHAHPDDESIDFGSLMSWASRSNKRVVTLLFTDGESGLDLYPNRKVGDIYPARDLTGAALSQVRVVEATRALSILGSEMYIRWGLENRPYNSKRDEVPPDEVIRGWGGEEYLVDRLIEVLEGFQPTIVVSPDGPSRAYEHFEHEAVGKLVNTALERLRRRGSCSIKGHLVSIDPYQVERYSGVSAVDAQIQDEESGLAYRVIQTLALKEHVTQRDACMIGVNRLSHLPREFYKAVFWDLDEPPENYLK